MLLDPAVIKVNIIMKIKITTPRSGPKPWLLKENESPDRPSGLHGGGGDKHKIKSILEYNWVNCYRSPLEHLNAAVTPRWAAPCLNGRRNVIQT
jgi:hypothetical protein